MELCKYLGSSDTNGVKFATSDIQSKLSDKEEKWSIMKKNIDQQKQTRKCGNRISRQGRTTFTATILHVFKELKGRLSMLSSDTKNILKTHIKLLDVETTMSQIKKYTEWKSQKVRHCRCRHQSTWRNNRNYPKQTTKWKKDWGKTWVERASEGCGTTLGTLTSPWPASQGEREKKENKENIWSEELPAENFPNFMKARNLQIQKPQLI